MEENDAVSIRLCETVYNNHVGRFHWLKGQTSQTLLPHIYL